MTEELFALIINLDSEELSCGHAHSKRAKAAYRGKIKAAPLPEEDNNIGDRAFATTHEDPAYL